MSVLRGRTACIGPPSAVSEAATPTSQIADRRLAIWCRAPTPIANLQSTICKRQSLFPVGFTRGGWTARNPIRRDGRHAGDGSPAVPLPTLRLSYDATVLYARAIRMTRRSVQTPPPRQPTPAASHARAPRPTTGCGGQQTEQKQENTHTLPYR